MQPHGPNRTAGFPRHLPSTSDIVSTLALHTACLHLLSLHLQAAALAKARPRGCVLAVAGHKADCAVSHQNHRVQPEEEPGRQVPSPVRLTPVLEFLSEGEVSPKMARVRRRSTLRVQLTGVGSSESRSGPRPEALAFSFQLDLGVEVDSQPDVPALPLPAATALVPPAPRERTSPPPPSPRPRYPLGEEGKEKEKPASCSCPRTRANCELPEVPSGENMKIFCSVHSTSELACD
ncbi:hypothetical protein ANANG_G00215930 [Anguilla anguilla]|uniref:Uncharacterized protein n=1 Tax=Anguilla anguilla TaxID=7936 RepID=A0A9D3RNZ8_ANGAN|nr:hypothetical protein ANANG_G00215930 [Anguilla anguilla]